MKKYGIAALAVAFVFSMAVSAQRPMQGRQDGPNPGHKKEFRQEHKEKLSPKKRAGYMAVDMDLTEAQRNKLQAHFEKQDQQREEHRAEMLKMKDQQMKKRDAMIKANDAEMEKILGTEKFNELKAKQADRKSKAKQFKNKRFGNQDKPGFEGRQGQQRRWAPQMEKEAPELKK
ncbi:MAG TPA: hypothetical protein P5084_06430 [Paludibacter sp.]|nr:hypothetical protein [Paludibacter sp.]